MKKKLLTLGIVLALVMAMVIPTAVFAADSGEVTCTVSGELISVSVAPGTVAYGILAPGATEDTVPAQTQTVTNDGNVAETFTIMSSDATGAGPWTLAEVAGEDIFTHTASIDAGATWDIVMNSATYVSLATPVAASGSVDVDLQIEMPTIVTDGTEKTITVTILAVKA